MLEKNIDNPQTQTNNRYDTVAEKVQDIMRCLPLPFDIVDCVAKYGDLSRNAFNMLLIQEMRLYNQLTSHIKSSSRMILDAIRGMYRFYVIEKLSIIFFVGQII